jgi:hypothetical protein
MLYSVLAIGGKELKLRMDAQNSVLVEKKLGKNPLNIFMNEDKSLPKLEELIIILHGSLQKYESGYTLAATYSLYDDYIDGGGTFTDFIPLMMDIFKVSGFFKEEDIEKAKDKTERKKRKAVVESLQA